MDVCVISNTPYEDPNDQLHDDNLEVGKTAQLLAHRLCENGMGQEVDYFFVVLLSELSMVY